MMEDKISLPPIDPSNPNQTTDILNVNMDIVPEKLLHSLPKAEAKAILKKQNKLNGRKSKREVSPGSISKTDRAFARHQKKIGMADLLANHVAIGEEFEDKTPPPEDFGQYDPESLEVSQITKYCPMVRFFVPSRYLDRKKYEFWTCQGFRGLMTPLKIMPISAIPDRRFIAHAWFKMPAELKGEAEVRTVARAIIEAYENVSSEVARPKESTVKKPTTEMSVFHIASRLNASKRYTFLTLPGWKGLWARNREFNIDGEFAPDPEWHHYYLRDKEIAGRKAIRAAAMMLVAQFEGITLDPPRIKNERRGTNHSIYLREEDDANLKTIGGYLRHHGGSRNGKSQAVQIALRELAERIENKEEIKIDDE